MAYHSKNLGRTLAKLNNNTLEPDAPEETYDLAKNEILKFYSTTNMDLEKEMLIEMLKLYIDKSVINS